MIAWEPDGTTSASAIVSLALVVVITEVLMHGMPAWWPAPAGSAAMFIVAAIALGVALARRPK